MKMSHIVMYQECTLVTCLVADRIMQAGLTPGSKLSAWLRKHNQESDTTKSENMSIGEDVYRRSSA